MQLYFTFDTSLIAGPRP